MEHSGTPSSTTIASIITSTPTTTHNSSLNTSLSTSGGVIVSNDPSSSDDQLGNILGSSGELRTPKRVSSSTIVSPVLSPPVGTILGRNCNGTSEFLI